MSLRDVTALFAQLVAPDFAEMDGEYTARLTDQGGRLATLRSRIGSSNPLFPGLWLCKAFTPGTGEPSHGYNSFRRLGRVERRFRMQTSMVDSHYDGKPSFQLDYVAMGSLLGKMKMVDELRRVRSGLYLGIGRYGFTDAEQAVPRPFTLEGPVGAFVGADPGLK